MSTDNPPAFPVQELNHDGSHFQTCLGMTLRDWFAGQALGGLVTGAYGGVTVEAHHASTFAEEAYRLADAMLAERAKGAGA